MPALDSHPLAAPTPAHRPRPALSLLLALTAGVLAVAAVRGATSEARPEQPEPEAPVARRAAGLGKDATLSLSRRTFPVH